MVYCVYSLESPRWGDSNENTRHNFMLQDNRKYISIIPPGLALWLVVLDLTALWDSISVYIGPSPREREKEKRNDSWEKKCPKQPPPASIASTIGPCPTIIQRSRTPQHWKFIQYLRTTRPPPPGAMINTHQLELPLSRTYFHVSKGIRAIEVLLYIGRSIVVVT